MHAIPHPSTTHRFGTPFSRPSSIVPGWLTLAMAIACLHVVKPSSTAADGAVPDWQTGDGLRGMDGRIRTTTLWDRDGSGGEDPVLVAAGVFTIAGTTFASNIALWNGEHWEPLGDGTPTGVNGDIYSLAVLPDGSLVAGGTFQRAGTELSSRIALWDGAAWAPLGSGLGTANTTVAKSMAVLPDGDLVVAGRFTTAGGNPANNIARWDGSAWHPLGAGLGDSTALINDLLVLPNGHLVAAGSFDSADGMPVDGVARWDGVAWHPVGDGIRGGVNSLARLPNGDLVAAGGTAAGSGSGTHVMRWDGISWSGMSAGLKIGSISVLDLAVMPDGTLVGGGAFATDTGHGGSNVAFWNGAAWVGLGGGTVGTTNSLTLLPNGDLVAAGDFLKAGAIHAGSIARWDGTAWRAFGTGFGGVSRNFIYAFLRLPNGDIVAGGDFTAAGTVEAHRIARWNGRRWFPMGSGMDDAVRALALLPDGDIVAGGSFRTADGVTARGVARWDGSAWSALGTDSPLENIHVYSLAVLPDGDLAACGSFFRIGGVNAQGLARWDGAAWNAFGSGVVGTASVLAVMPDGDLVLGGGFSAVDGTPVKNLARWDGQSWADLGGGTNSAVHALLPLPDGDLLVGGRFGTAGGVVVSRIARWDGVAWSGFGTGTTPLGSPEVNAIAALADGRIVAGGKFTRIGTVETENVALWDGSEWVGLGSGTSAAFDSRVHALAALPDGGFVMGGGFAAVNDRPLATFAHWGFPAAPPDPLGGLLPVAHVRMGIEGLRFSFEGLPGRRYTVRHTLDFRNWDVVATGLEGAVDFEDTDPDRRARPAGYYQVVEEEAAPQRRSPDDPSSP